MSRHDAERTAMVNALRELSARVAHLAGTTYFPSKDPRERQPIQLDGYISQNDLADLLHYVADMLE